MPSNVPALASTSPTSRPFTPEQPPGLDPRRRFAIRSAATALAGALASGPLAISVVSLLHPQPPWTGVDAFITAYHPIQTLPYFCGFFLVGGFVCLIAALQRTVPSEARPRTLAAVAFAATFASLICFNYVLQTTVVPTLVANPNGASRDFIALLTMSNPASVGWALEMWGYAVLGVATWLAAPAFEMTGLAGFTRWLYVANGPLSIAGGILTAILPGWVLSWFGLLSFGIWNLLIAAMLVCTILVFGRRRAYPAV